MTIQKLGGSQPISNEQVEVPCRECGVVIQYPKSVLDWLGEKAVVCDPCCTKLEELHDGTTAKRKESFRLYCPPLYYEIIEKSYEKIPPRMREIAHLFDYPRGLLLHGPSGSYKTTIMWLIIKNLWMCKNIRATAMGATELAREIAVSFDRKNGYEDLIQQKTACVFLCIDDLGKERMTPRIEEAIFEILNVRCEKKKCTMITTNFVGEPLQERFLDAETGKAFVRRIRDYMDIHSSVSMQDTLNLAQNTK
jgi:DNA replication protein DnaC